jgi:hypothetical protein
MKFLHEQCKVKMIKNRKIGYYFNQISQHSRAGHENTFHDEVSNFRKPSQSFFSLNFANCVPPHCHSSDTGEETVVSLSFVRITGGLCQLFAAAKSLPPYRDCVTRLEEPESVIF